MPRKYDKVIRYYSSWFADFGSPEKAFTDHELVQLFYAIRDCQVEGSLEPIENLPLEIRRALSMATMGEQMIRLIEVSESNRNKGANGGNKAAANRRTPEHLTAASMRAEKEAKEAQERDAAYERSRKSAIKPSEYVEMLVKAAKGDAEILAKFGMSQDEAIKLCNRKGIAL